jgi:hypothetical protein
MLATFARTGPITPRATERTHAWFEPWHLRWLVPLATAATVVGIWVAIPEDRRIPVSNEVTERTDAQSKVSKEDHPAAPPVPTVPGAKDGKVAEGQATGGVGSEERSATAAKRSAPALVPAPYTVNPQANQALDKAEQERARAESDQMTFRDSRLSKPAAPPPAPPPATAAAAEAPPAVVSGTTAAPKKEVDNLTLQRSAPPVEIVSPNPAERWRIVDGRQVQRSTTGGAQWDVVAVQPPDRVTTGHSPGPSTLWLVGRAGGIYVTTSGSPFIRVPFIESIDLVSIVAVDDRQATVTTADGRTFRTTNQGRTWTLVQEIAEGSF